LRDGFQCFFSECIVSSLRRMVLFCHDWSLHRDNRIRKFSGRHLCDSPAPPYVMREEARICK
jgi:hypothetical protein